MYKLKNTSIRKRSNGVYELRFYLDGVCKSVYSKDEKKLKEKYKEYLLNHKSGVNKSKFKLNDYYNIWLNKYKINIITTATIERIESLFKIHISKKIGHKNMEKITEDDIRSLLNDLNSMKRTKTLCYVYLKDIFSKAIKDSVINKNVLDNITIAKTNGERGKALTKDQELILLNYLKESDHYLTNLIKFYLYTGVRRNEALNLKLEDIDFKNKTIHVKGTKSASSDRIIKTNDAVLNLINRQNNKLFNYSKDKVNQDFLKIVRKLNLGKISIHSLRHTFATRCLEAGIEMKVVQKWLGHSSIKITSDIYTHISKDFENKQADKLPFN